MGCYNSIIVNAPVEKVWAAFRNFHDLSCFPNVIENCEAVGDVPGTQAGAKRILNGAFHETLISLDDDKRQLRYSIDDGPAAIAADKVAGYVGTVNVYSNTEDDSTFVLWTSEWASSEGGVAELCDPVYRALLGDLKGYFASVPDLA